MLDHLSLRREMMNKIFKISTQTKDDFVSAAGPDQNRIKILADLKNIVSDRFDQTDLIVDVEIKNPDDGLMHHFKLKSFSIERDDQTGLWTYNFIFDYNGFEIL